MRQRLTVAKKITYRLIAFRKRGELGPQTNPTSERSKPGETFKAKGFGAMRAMRSMGYRLPKPSDTMGIKEATCEEVRFAKGDESRNQLAIERPGEGRHCISPFYCCGFGLQWWDFMNSSRTDVFQYLKTERKFFGDYWKTMIGHLNTYYASLPANAVGKFLDIGGTGSTVSGMQQVTSKFLPWAGPLEYWKNDVDKAAVGLPRTILCDISNCPEIADCSFDITFSHTVLEHIKNPWAAFDTIARITKKGGLSIHLVPWSYQFHATPTDYYRFSHQALVSNFEDRGFTVLDVGYDICQKPNNMKTKITEHFDIIWLPYIVARKN